jgi:hypothetical protein
MNKQEQIENIHNNLINGNRRDCVKQIKAYGLYDFWSDYKDYLEQTYGTPLSEHGANYFTDMTISYFRITNR